MPLIDYSSPDPAPIFDYDDEPLSVCGSTMHVTNASARGWVFTSFAEKMNRGKTSHDRVYVHESGLGIQLGVLDGALNTLDLRADVKTRAALDVTVASISMFGLEQGLRRAALAIHDPDAVNRHRNATLAFAGVEITGPTVRVARNGDCVVWARRGGDWVEVLPGDMLTALGRSAYEHGIAAKAAGESDWAVQESALDDDDRWALPPLGHHPLPLSRTLELPATDVDELVVASDGADLNENRLQDIAGWMTRGRHVRQPENTLRYPHGDLSLIWARRTA